MIPTLGTRALVAIVGPTAVGKTALALQVAEDLPVEVISADSRQVYRFMDIGTAKPTVLDRQRVPHHLIDVVAPDEPFSLAQYQELAQSAIDRVHARGHIPLLVGGTGLYIRSVLQGLTIPHVEPDRQLREHMMAEAEAHGCGALHQRLRILDPVAAQRIDPRNVRRVIRALEVCSRSGQPISSLQRTSPPPYPTLCIGLTMPRPQLYARIDQRVQRMVAAGWIDEVRSLVAGGYDYSLPAMSGLGYREIGMHLRGEVSLQEAMARTRWRTHRFVRQQATWFRSDDAAIAWFDAGGAVAEAVVARVRAFLAQVEATPAASQCSA